MKTLNLSCLETYTDDQLYSAAKTLILELESRRPTKKKGSRPLGKRDLAMIEAEAKEVETPADTWSGDLYKALHRVGDDTVKAEIQSNLRRLLDEETFRKVVAVFNLSTGWKEGL